VFEVPWQFETEHSGEVFEPLELVPENSIVMLKRRKFPAQPVNLKELFLYLDLLSNPLFPDIQVVCFRRFFRLFSIRRWVVGCVCWEPIKMALEIRGFRCVCILTREVQQLQTQFICLAGQAMGFSFGILASGVKSLSFDSPASLFDGENHVVRSKMWIRLKF
jgi:hypothetical protein